MAYVSPRGLGREAWSGDAKRQNQLARRFYLLGATADGQRTWDVARSVAAAHAASELKDVPLWLQAEEPGLAGIALYASLFAPNVKRLDLYGLPVNHRNGPFYLNIDRVLDLPQAVALAAERSQVILYGEDQPQWAYPRAVAAKLELGEKRLQIRKPPAK
jgi:hypothetical protein